VKIFAEHRRRRGIGGRKPLVRSFHRKGFIADGSLKETNDSQVTRGARWKILKSISRERKKPS